MINKTKIALSALIVFGFASTALANGADQYARDLWLQPQSQEVAGASAFAFAGGQHPTRSNVVQGSVKSYSAQEKAMFDRETATHGLY